MTDSWFQRNPKKTLAGVVLIFLLVIVLGAERLLGFINHRRGIVLEAETERRYIKLREQRPGRQMRLKFPKNHLAFTDNVFTKTYKVDIDENGFIKPSRKYADPDLSMVFLGGSTTECMFMDELNRFPYLAGVLLEKETGKRINSYNGGLSGNNSLHAIDLLVNKVIPLHPRVVVFMENINDLSTLLYKKTYWNKNNVRAPMETLVKSKLAGKMLKEMLIPNLNEAWRNFTKTLSPHEEDEFAKAHKQRLTLDGAGMAREFAMNLQMLIDICRDRGITPVLMTQGNRITAKPDPVVAAYIGQYSQDTGVSYQDFKTVYDLFNDTIRQVGRKNGVMVIDLANEVPPDKEHLYDMVHFNDAGSKLAAKIIAAQLRPVIASSKQ
ncbi:MAG: SGNH/GDSL hydrolase family protein [Deltaproteobacteria bacterium]|nr:SGNH/GDSL hydrolase family protein [Deltaproteobacteria bacterium]